MPMTLTRSLLTILIPGLIAIAPWALAFMYLTSTAMDVAKYSALTNALIFASSAVAGALFEGAGTNFEVSWDKERESEYGVTDNWYLYLSRSFEKEPVGYRYISRLVTTLYFELSMMFAIPVFFLGVGAVTMLRFPENSVVLALGSLVAMVASGIYMHKQAKCTHRVICETRLELNQRVAAS